MISDSVNSQHYTYFLTDDFEIFARPRIDSFVSAPNESFLGVSKGASPTIQFFQYEPFVSSKPVIAFDESAGILKGSVSFDRKILNLEDFVFGFNTVADSGSWTQVPYSDFASISESEDGMGLNFELDLSGYRDETLYDNFAFGWAPGSSKPQLSYVMDTEDIFLGDSVVQFLGSTTNN